jgi:hypothetical protein
MFDTALTGPRSLGPLEIIGAGTDSEIHRIRVVTARTGDIGGGLERRGE